MNTDTLSPFETQNGYKLRKKVRAIIVDEQQRYLLIQPHSYAHDSWTLVGGSVEDGESYEQAILREIREETGIADIRGLHLSKEIHWFCFSQRIKNERKLDYDGQVARIFLVFTRSNGIINIQHEEVRAFCWAEAGEIDGLIKVPEQQELFKKVVQEFKELGGIPHNL